MEGMTMTGQRELLQAAKYALIHAEAWEMHVENEAKYNKESLYTIDYWQEVKDDNAKLKAFIEHSYGGKQ